MPLVQRIDEQNVIPLHSEELHSRKIKLKFMEKWIDLENIVLSEVTQTQKDNYYMYSLTYKWLLDITQRNNSQSPRT